MIQHPTFRLMIPVKYRAQCYDKHYNTTGHCSGVWGHEIENNITVDAMVRDVTYKSGEQVIRVAVNAYGHTEEKGTRENGYWQHYTAKALEIHGELGEDAPDDAKIGLDYEFNRRGNMSGDNDIGGGEGDHDLWKRIARTGMSEFAGRVPVFGQFYTVSEFMTEHYIEGGSWEIFNPSGSGSGGDAGQAFETRPFNWPDFENADDIDERNYFYVASTQFTVTIPGDIPNEMHISFSAKNVIGYWEGLIHLGNEDAAEASVEITIKNANPDIQQELDADDDHYDAGEGSSVVSPVFQELKVTNPAQCTDVTYEVEIELRADWTDGFETLTYAWITHDEVLDKQVNIHVPEGTENEEVDIRYSVSTSEKYGGWELDPVSRYNLFKVTNEETDDGGGSGGGGGAPVHPTGDGTG